MGLRIRGREGNFSGMHQRGGRPCRVRGYALGVDDVLPPEATTCGALGLVLDASIEADVTVVSDKVSEFADACDFGSLFVQGTADNRPAYTTLINGLRVITFDGANDSLRDTGFPIETALPDTAQWGGFFVGRYHTGLAATVPVSNSPAFFVTDDLVFGLFVYDVAPTKVAIVLNDGTEWTASANITLNSIFVCSFWFRDGTLYIRVNGGPTNSAGGGLISGPTIAGNTSMGQRGATGFFDGDYGELHLLPYAPSEAEIIGYERALAEKWGVTLHY